MTRSASFRAASIKIPPIVQFPAWAHRAHNAKMALPALFEQSAPVLYDRFIVLSLQCILAEKFSFQREDGEYSDLRSGNVAFPRPRPTFSWSPTMAPFRANSIAVFGRSLSRTAPGEWLENLCSFIPGSVPIFGPRPEITRLLMRISL